MGSYVSTLNDSDDAIYIKYGPRDLMDHAIAFIGAVIPGLAVLEGAFGAAIIQTIDKEAKESGLSKLWPDDWYTSDKLSLSLAVQANILKVWSDDQFLYAQRGSIDCRSAATAGETEYYRVNGDTQWEEVHKWDLKGKDGDGDFGSLERDIAAGMKKPITVEEAVSNAVAVVAKQQA